MYYFILIFSLMLGLITKYKYGRKIYCFIMFMIFFLVSGLRKGIGYDFNPYMNTFYNSYLKDTSSFLNSSIEKGYLILNEVVSNSTSHYQFLILIIAFFVSASVMWFIYKYSKNVWLSSFSFIAFGCFYFSMDYLRQIFAGIIMLYGFKALENKDWGKYFLLVLLASCFHKSALLLLPLFIILELPMNKIILSIYTIGTMICFFFSESIIQFVLDKGYYSAYVLTNVHMTTGIPIVYGIVTSAIFLLGFILRKKCIEFHPINRILIQVAFLNAFFTLLGAKHSILSRFTVLLEIPVIIILLVDCILICIDSCKQKYIQVSILIGFIIFSFGYHAILEMNNYNGVFPYKMIGVECNDKTSIRS